MKTQVIGGSGVANSITYFITPNTNTSSERNWFIIKDFNKIKIDFGLYLKCRFDKQLNNLKDKITASFNPMDGKGSPLGGIGNLIDSNDGGDTLVNVFDSVFQYSNPSLTQSKKQRIHYLIRRTNTTWNYL